MASGKIQIGIDLEPICKVFCERIDCKHHLITREYMACNLKYLEIDATGYCQGYEARQEKNRDGNK